MLNGRAIWFSPSVTRVAYSDASSTGYGGYVVELGPQISCGQWTADQAKCSSTWRELRAVDFVLRSFAPMLQGRSIKWLSDNHNVVRIIQNGSKKPHYIEHSTWPQVVYKTFHLDWKLQNNHEKRSISQTKEFITIR